MSKFCNISGAATSLVTWLVLPALLMAGAGGAFGQAPVSDGGKAIEWTLNNPQLPAGTFDLFALMALPSATKNLVLDRQLLPLKANADGSGFDIVSHVDAQAEPMLPSEFDTPRGWVGSAMQADELWLEYETGRASIGCQYTAEIEVLAAPRSKAEGPTRFLDFTTAAPEARTVDYDLGSGVVPRTNAYLLMRQIGGGVDDNWRATESGPSVVLMRRVGIDLRDIQTLDLTVRPEVTEVNMRLSRNEQGLPTDILTGLQLDSDEEYRNGERHLIIDMSKVLAELRSRTPGRADPISIVEIVAFTPKASNHTMDDVGKVDQPSILHAETTIAAQAENSDHIWLSSTIEPLSGGNRRLRISLGRLRSLPYSDIRLSGVQMVTARGSECSARLRRAEFVKLAPVQIPQGIFRFEQLATRLGLPTPDTEAGASGIRVATLVRSVSLAAYSGNLLPARTFDRDHPLSLPLMDMLLTARGGGEAEVILDSDGLSIPPPSPFGLTWDVPFSVPEGAYFVVQSPATEGELWRGILTLDLMDGEARNFPIQPNQAVDLKDTSGLDVERVHLEIDRMNGRTVIIQQMSFLTFETMTESRAVSARLPELHWQVLEDLDLDFGRMSSTREVGGELQSTALRVALNLETPVQGCWLGIQLSTADRSRRHEICNSESGETVSVSLTGLGPLADGWSYRIDSTQPPGTQTVGSLSIEVERLSAPSLLEDLAAFEVGVEKSLFSPDEIGPEAQEDILRSGNTWVRLGKINWDGGEFWPVVEEAEFSAGNPIKWIAVYAANPVASETLLQRLLVPLVSPVFWLSALVAVAIIAVSLFARIETNSMGRAAAGLTGEAGQRAAEVQARAATALCRLWRAWRKRVNAMTLAAIWAGTIAFISYFPDPKLRWVAAAGLVLFTIAGVLHHLRWSHAPGEVPGALSRWAVGKPGWLGHGYVLAFALAYVVLSVFVVLRLLAVISDPDILIAISRVDVLNLPVMFSLVLAIGYFVLEPWLLLAIGVLLAASVYGLLPWLTAWLGPPLSAALARVGPWPLIALALFAASVVQSSVLGTVLLLSGVLVLIVACQDVFRRNIDWIRKRWPREEITVFERRSSPYFAGSFVGLLVCAVLMMGPLARLAEPLGTIVYIMIVTALLFEAGGALAKRRKASRGDDSARLAE